MNHFQEVDLHFAVSPIHHFERYHTDIEILSTELDNEMKFMLLHDIHDTVTVQFPAV